MNDEPRETTNVLPDRFAAVSLLPDTGTSPLRICLVVRREPKATDALVVLREMLDTVVYLGCVVDAASNINRWLEIWVQDAARGFRGQSFRQDVACNSTLDQRWHAHINGLGHLGLNGIIHTGYEQTFMPPLFLDLKRMCVKNLHSGGASGIWDVCRDDRKLANLGLAPYSSSTERYLCLASDEAAPLVPLSGASSTNSKTARLEDVLPESKDWIPVSLGGCIAVRPLLSTSYEALVAILSGAAPFTTANQTLDGDSPALDRLELLATTDGAHSGRLFLAQNGLAGRFLETFHLKLRSILQTLLSVREHIEKTQCPLLNATPANFRVQIGSTAVGLPALWTGKVVLVDPGAAIERLVPGTQFRYFVTTSADSGIYMAPIFGRSSSGGRASLRIRNSEVTPEGKAIFEGTFATQERLDPARGDLAIMRLTLANIRLDLFATLDAPTAMARGEWRFRSLPLSSEVQPAVLGRAAEGFRSENVDFEILPLASTPCDLYSLAVLGIRTLLVNSNHSLPIALDGILSLTNELRTDDSGRPLEATIASLFTRDPRWKKSLGPQHLLETSIDPDASMELLPTVLWFETLASLVRMLPGECAESTCRDFGDAPQGRLHSVFDVAISAFERLLVRSRSLLIVDWQSNRELNMIVNDTLREVTRRDAAAPPASHRK